MNSKILKKILIIIITIFIVILFLLTGKYVLSGRPFDYEHKQYVSKFVNILRNSKTYEKYRGRGINIAVVDSGISVNLTDLPFNSNREIVFLDETAEKGDSYGHGTEIAGIIGATDDSKGLVGVAPEATIYSLKVLNDSGVGKVESVISALEWCLNNDIDVVNLSFSTKYRSEELEKIISELYKKGTIVVASYSNLENTFDYPAMLGNVIGVKATSDNRITQKDGIIYAYGNNVITMNNKNKYVKVNGNSFATAHVTGAIALILEKDKKGGMKENLEEIRNKLVKIF